MALRSREPREARKPWSSGSWRSSVSLGALLALLVVGYFVLGGIERGKLSLPRSVSLSEEVRQIRPLELRDRQHMARQRELVRDLALRHVGTPLSGGSLEDLRVLQDILDMRLFAPDQVYELQALGVALGDVIAEQLGLSWVLVEDEVGRSRALRYGESGNLLFPVTMISRRLQFEQRFTVLELYEVAERGVAEFATIPVYERP